MRNEQSSHRQSIEAMEEVSWKVQNASTYSRLLNEEWMEVSRETNRAATVSPSGQWKKCPGRFKMQALTVPCSTRSGWGVS